MSEAAGTIQSFHQLPIGSTVMVDGVPHLVIECQNPTCPFHEEGGGRGAIIHKQRDGTMVVCHRLEWVTEMVA